MSATSARVQRALSEFLHAERVDGNPALFRVASGSGARYEVDLSGKTLRCQCDDWMDRQVICKHILFVLLTHPGELDRVIR
jgi:hypothetical protein